MAKVINLFGGPGCGKSTLAALLFAELKMLGFNCEMALEYAKDKVWEESYHTLDNQIYVFGKQHHRMFRLKENVDIIITDSPLVNSILYDSTNNSMLRELVLFEFNKYQNYNFLIERPNIYDTNGRMQSEEEAKKLDSQVEELLLKNNIQFGKIAYGHNGVKQIVDLICNEKN